MTLSWSRVPINFWVVCATVRSYQKPLPLWVFLMLPLNCCQGALFECKWGHSCLMCSIYGQRVFQRSKLRQDSAECEQQHAAQITSRMARLGRAGWVILRLWHLEIRDASLFVDMLHFQTTCVWDVSTTVPWFFSLKVSCSGLSVLSLLLGCWGSLALVLPARSTVGGPVLPICS